MVFSACYCRNTQYEHCKFHPFSVVQLVLLLTDRFIFGDCKVCSSPRDSKMLILFVWNLSTLSTQSSGGKELLPSPCHFERRKK